MSDVSLEALTQDYRCDRYIYTKVKHPKAKRAEWCRWCHQFLRGTDGCPVAALRPSPHKD